MNTARDEMAWIAHKACGCNGECQPDREDWETADALIAAGYRKVNGDALTKAKAAAWNECAGAIRLDSEADALWLKSVNPYEPRSTHTHP